MTKDQALLEIERKARAAMRKLDKGLAVNGYTALREIKYVAQDARAKR